MRWIVLLLLGWLWTVGCQESSQPKAQETTPPAVLDVATVEVAEVTPCHCGPDCQCQKEIAEMKEAIANKNEMLSEYRAMTQSLEADFESKLAEKHAEMEAVKHAAYLAEQKLTAAAAVTASHAVVYQPTYYRQPYYQQPTTYGQYYYPQSSCGAGGCGPVGRGFFGWRR